MLPAIFSITQTLPLLPVLLQFFSSPDESTTFIIDLISLSYITFSDTKASVLSHKFPKKNQIKKNHLVKFIQSLMSLEALFRSGEGVHTVVARVDKKHPIKKLQYLKNLKQLDLERNLEKIHIFSRANNMVRVRNWAKNKIEQRIYKGHSTKKTPASSKKMKSVLGMKGFRQKFDLDFCKKPTEHYSYWRKKGQENELQGEKRNSFQQRTF